jgi:hypothetical protein
MSTLGINGPRRESSRSGNLGFAMTEKDADERVCYSLCSLTFCLLFGRSRKRRKPKLPGDCQVKELKVRSIRWIVNLGQGRLKGNHSRVDYKNLNRNSE